MQSQPTPILFHGACSTSHIWDDVVASHDGPVQALDLWQLARDWECPDITSFGRLLARELSCSYDAVSLAGYSMGGRLALATASALEDMEPGCLCKLTLLAAHPGLSSESEREQRRAVDTEIAKRLMEEGLEKFLPWWDALPIFGGYPAKRSDVEMEALKVAEEDLATAFLQWSLGNQEDYRPLLKRLSSVIPVEFVCGAEDEKFCQLGEELEALGVSVRVVEGCGHRVPLILENR